MRILFFGRLAEAFGSAVEIQLSDGCSVAELRQRLAADHSEVAETLLSGRVRACVARRLVGDDYLISSSDQVEFLSVVSGG